VMVSSQEFGPPSRATEIVIGGISTKSTRRVSSPVTHMLEPPSISGPHESLELIVTEVVSLQSIPQTLGDVSTREILATVAVSTRSTNVCHRVGGGHGVFINSWAKEPLGNSIIVKCGGGSGGGRTTSVALGIGWVSVKGAGLIGTVVRTAPAGGVPSSVWHEPTHRFVPYPSHSTAETSVSSSAHVSQSI
jgi:hypothetical protein